MGKGKKGEPIYLPGKQVDKDLPAQTVDDIAKIKAEVTRLLSNSETGIKNKIELETLISDALKHGDCVAITSYTDYPEAIVLMLEKLHLSEEERAKIYIASHLPFYIDGKPFHSDGKMVRFGEAPYDNSRGKDLHMLEALKHFQAQGKEIDELILVDDSKTNVTVANVTGHMLDGIRTRGILVNQSPTADPSYIEETRKAMGLPPALTAAPAPESDSTRAAPILMQWGKQHTPTIGSEPITPDAGSAPPKSKPQ